MGCRETILPEDSSGLEANLGEGEIFLPEDPDGSRAVPSQRLSEKSVVGPSPPARERGRPRTVFERFRVSPRVAISRILEPENIEQGMSKAEVICGVIAC